MKTAHLRLTRVFRHDQPVVVFTLIGITRDNDWPEEVPLEGATAALKSFEGLVPAADIQAAEKQIAVYDRGARLFVEENADGAELVLERPDHHPIRLKVNSRAMTDVMGRMAQTERGCLNDVPAEDIEAVRAWTPSRSRAEQTVVLPPGQLGERRTGFFA